MRNFYRTFVFGKLAYVARREADMGVLAYREKYP